MASSFFVFLFFVISVTYQIHNTLQLQESFSHYKIGHSKLSRLKKRHFNTQTIFCFIVYLMHEQFKYR